MPAHVDASQFIDDGALAVIHTPTGTRYSTYPYPQPDQLTDPLVRGMNDQDSKGNVYSPVDMATVALDLLRKKLAKG